MKNLLLGGKRLVGNTDLLFDEVAELRSRTHRRWRRDRCLETRQSGIKRRQIGLCAEDSELRIGTVNRAACAVPEAQLGTTLKPRSTVCSRPSYDLDLYLMT